LPYSSTLTELFHPFCSYIITENLIVHGGYAHFTLEKAVEVEPETLMAIDMGEHNLAVAILKSNLDKPMKGRF
jgi:hypothetical protein